MKFFLSTLLLTCSIKPGQAFAPPSYRRGSPMSTFSSAAAASSRSTLAPTQVLLSTIESTAATASTTTTSTRLANSSSNTMEQPEKDEVQKLREMAQKLRAEAGELEAEQREAMNKAVESMFRRFDLNEDGKISKNELQKGLEKLFRKEITPERTTQLLESLDQNGNGVLELEEFVGADRLRNQVDRIERQERQAAREAAQAERQQVEQAQQLETQLAMVNDNPPTPTDRLVSVLPYLFPLIDGLQFGRFFIEGSPENPLAIAATVAYALYRSVPLGGFLSFFALNFLSSNPKLNKLVRFNLQQAVYLDIALFAPALVASLGLAALTQLGVELPANVVEIGSDAAFVSLLLAVGYSTISSLLGATPNGLPGISQRVERGMIRPDMFDADGNFRPFDEAGNLKESNNDKNDDNQSNKQD